MENTGTFYTRRNGNGKNQMENAVQDSEEDVKQVFYFKCFIARGNFNQNICFLCIINSAMYSSSRLG